MGTTKKKKEYEPGGRQRQERYRVIVIVGVMLAISLALLYIRTIENRAALEDYKDKLALLAAAVFTEETATALGENPAGAAGYAVFLSLCDGESRAQVVHGTGESLKAAWDAADKAVRSALVAQARQPLWLKADVVSFSQEISEAELQDEVLFARQEFFRFGLAFDKGYDLALLEAELNGNRIYEYEEGGVSLSYLNNYLEKLEQEPLPALPERYTLFSCRSWLCDETDAVYPLAATGLACGRRSVETVDQEFVAGLVESASAFLLEQVKEDGSFVYGIYPRFDNTIENYNIVRHASTIWSLICRYRMLPDEALKEAVEQTIDYMLGELRYADDDTAYLYESKADEIKLGANGVAVIAMTEYMDVFESDRYVEECRALGNGILTLLNAETGTYYHVLNGDFSHKEEYRTVYYDGEATFALCRLYSLTGEEKWLDAAKSAVSHFIEADYTQHKDHWIAYSMNEITKHVDDPAYYTFALQNVQNNLEEIYYRDTTYHTYLELLMVSFELYGRMMDEGIAVDYLAEFDLPFFLKTIYARADRQLDGFFFPEYAMYMENPARILGTFMVRHDGYRVRIDDVQHNIGGLYLYYKNYERLVEYGMLQERD